MHSGDLLNFFDLHCDTAYKIYENGYDFLNCDLLAVTPLKAKSFKKWYQCFAVFIKDGQIEPFEYYKNVLNSFKLNLKNAPHNLTAIFTVENGNLIGNDLNRVEYLYNDGIRAITLTWNGENNIAGGVDTDIGLKNFGREVIAEMNRYGIAVDLSHLNKKSFYSALELADTPVITHSALNCINNHKRNIDDFQLKSLVQKGGKFGLCFYPKFLGDGDVFENIYKNVFHILDMGYEDYLCIGSDFDGADTSKKLYDISYVPSLFEYLNDRKINKNILNKIFFENAYNFFKKRGS